jgi:2-polyprenyl-6-methoxyphenol hydroxylase-like FAD-dependent oxidoreductase
VLTAKGTLYQVGYNLLLGADGAESTVRTAMKRAKPKVRDFQVQRPVQDTEQWKSFTGLPQV